MRKTTPEKLEQGRFKEGPWGSDSSYELNGAFQVQGPCGMSLRIIASDGNHGEGEQLGWEHVSVSTASRCPNWQEMCFVKNLFWDGNEVVVEFHPAEKDYVNNHPHCLHLWRHKTKEFNLPPIEMVGIK